MFRYAFLLLLLTAAVFTAPQALAQEDDTYDPFSDYSEFDEASEEEADVNFFRNGRFLTVGFMVGQRGFTQYLNTLYSAAPSYGLYLSYFFDLRTAIQFGFNTGDHAFNLETSGGNKLTGNVSLTLLHCNLKYFFNTQNVTKGVANLNPYLIGGFSQVYRTYTLTGQDGFGRDATMGVDAGAGVEIPIMRRKAFFGFQGTFHSVNFKDENSPITLPDGTVTTATPKGDTFDFLAILGLNF
jgi:hypothetical protein